MFPSGQIYICIYELKMIVRCSIRFETALGRQRRLDGAWLAVWLHGEEALPGGAARAGHTGPALSARRAGDGVQAHARLEGETPRGCFWFHARGRAVLCLLYEELKAAQSIDVYSLNIHMDMTFAQRSWEPFQLNWATPIFRRCTGQHSKFVYQVHVYTYTYMRIHLYTLCFVLCAYVDLQFPSSDSVPVFLPGKIAAVVLQAGVEASTVYLKMRRV